VQKIYLILILQKQLYIPSNPLLASFSGYVAEIQCCQGFCEIKTTSHPVSKKMIMLKSLPDKASVIFKKNKIERKKFCCN
jgi:hypothetical protein